MATIEPTNLLPTGAQTTPEAQRERSFTAGLRILRAVVIVAVVAFGALSWTTRSSDPNVLRALGGSAAVRSVLSLLRSPNSMLQGERDDRVTALLLGMGGEGHDGPLLADTILVASVQPSTRRATLISVPRDLLISLPDGRNEKANAINAYAERGGGEGAIALRDALEDVLGIRIPYYARVDFRGFVGLIDAIGGVIVDVERTLDDPQYPIAGKENAQWPERFERLIIPAGRQRMDGSLALKYTRSRHALGVEGSDFARARRQQRFFLALRDRLLRDGSLARPRALLALFDTWRDHVQTNLSPPEMLRLSSFASIITGDDVARIVFTDAPNGELVAALWNGAYVLRPRNGTFAEIRGIIQRALAANDDAAKPSPVARQYLDEQNQSILTVEIWNGTNVNGLAGETAASLRREGFTITAVRNAPSRTVERSIIYRSVRVPDDAVTKLREFLRADVSTAFPKPLTSETLPDILIVIGTSSATEQ